MKRRLLSWVSPLALALALGACTSTAEQIRSLRQRADSGDVEAELALARRYAEADGVEQDAVQAASLYRRAAEAGNPAAQLALGMAYRDGVGVPQDDQEALGWIRKAAGAGNAGARFVLGIMYEDGAGVPRDPVAAHAWLNLAAAGLPPEERERAVRHRDWLTGVMTPAQVAEAQRLAREWAQQGK